MSSALPARRSTAAPSRGPHGRLARLALASGAAFAAAVALVVFFDLVGIDAEDNWLALVVLAVMAAGVLGSFAAFALSLARIRSGSGPLLWLPFSVFPAIVAFVVLGELFWWE